MSTDERQLALDRVASTKGSPLNSGKRAFILLAKAQSYSSPHLPVASHLTDATLLVDGN